MGDVLRLRKSAQATVWRVDRMSTTLPDGREALVFRSEADGTFAAKVGDEFEPGFSSLREAQDWASRRRK